MPSDPDFHDSAAAWLDNTTDPSGHRLFREILRDSPEASLAFASLARTESALHMGNLSRQERLERARRLIQPSFGSRLRRLAVRPAFHWPAAALLAGIVWFAFSGGDTESVPRKPHIAPAPVRKAPAFLPEIPVSPTQLAPADANFVQRMSRFIVPGFTAKGLTLAEALETLQAGIRSIDASAVPDFSAAATLPRDLKVDLHLKYQSVKTLVQIIGIQTGTKFRASGRGYVIFPDPKALPPDSITHKTWERQALAAFFQQQGKTLEETEPPAVSGNEGKSKDELASQTEKVNQFSETMADLFGERPSEVLMGTNAITIHSSSREDLMLSSLVKAGSGYPPGTWEWTAHVLTLKTPEARKAFETLRENKGLVSGTGTTFTNEDSAAILRELSQVENVEVASLPALVTRPGAAEKSFTGKESADPLTKPDEWTGMRFQITSEPCGEHGGFELNTIQQSIDASGSVSVSEMSTKSSVEDGQTLFFGGLISEQSGETVVLLSARRDPPFSEDIPYGIPVIGSPGMAFSPYAENKGQVDISGLKRGAKIRCPFTGKTFRVP